MEKRNFSEKTILKLIGALLALAYLGFCLYAGITGKFPSMHRVEHIMRFGDLKNWVSGGMSAVMIFAFCITSALNDLNLQKGRKKSFLPLCLTMILALWVTMHRPGNDTSLNVLYLNGMTAKAKVDLQL